MTPFDRQVRSTIYRLFVDQVRDVDAAVVAAYGGWDVEDVETSLRSLAGAHRLSLTPAGLVGMAHPFSGVPTAYRASVGDDWWFANCAWDALAILSMLGDGDVTGPTGPLWRIDDGMVDPDGLVHLVVPARSFWEDVGFTWANIHGFRSEAEFEEWRDATGADQGYLATAQTMYDLSRDWYAGRMDEGWEPPTAEQAGAIFEKHGLTGPFWSLD